MTNLQAVHAAVPNLLLTLRGTDSPVLMSFISVVIHTCQLCGANSFDYLIEVQRHARELAVGPVEWMPWNYRDTL